MEREGAQPGLQTCLVLAAPETELPGTLSSALSRRGLSIERCTDAYAAFAQVLAPDAAGARALIVVEPTRVRHVDQLAAALSVYAPQVARWRYAGALTPPLARLGDDVAPPPRPTEPASTTVQRAPAQPALRLVGDAPPPAPPTGDILDGPDDADTDHQRPSSLLSPEELDLLLAPDDADTPDTGSAS